VVLIVAQPDNDDRLTWVESARIAGKFNFDLAPSTFLSPESAYLLANFVPGPKYAFVPQIVANALFNGLAIAPDSPLCLEDGLPMAVGIGRHGNSQITQHFFSRKATLDQYLNFVEGILSNEGRQFYAARS
jgi:hypothetical protein